MQSFAGSGEYYVDVSAPMGPPPPSLSVADTSMTEGVAGTRPLPEQLTKTVTVQVAGDTVVEPNELFFVRLSSASGATIADSNGRGTILNDDAPAELSVGDVRIAEGTAAATFRVTLSHTSEVPVVANFLTENGTAFAPGDYAPRAGTVSFAPGEVGKTITVPVVADALDEPEETFALTAVAPVNATIADGAGTATIADDDPPPGSRSGTRERGSPTAVSGAFASSSASPRRAPARSEFALRRRTGQPARRATTGGAPGHSLSCPGGRARSSRFGAGRSSQGAERDLFRETLRAS